MSGRVLAPLLVILSLASGCGGSKSPAASAATSAEPETQPPPASGATSLQACNHAWKIIKVEAPKEFAGKSDEEAMAQCLEKLDAHGSDEQRLHCEIDCVMAAQHLKQIDVCVNRYCTQASGLH